MANAISSFALCLITVFSFLEVHNSDNTSLHSLCPIGWRAVGHKCFGYVGGARSWDSAEIFCHGQNGRLAALLSVQELNLAQHLCKNIGGGCWVGGRTHNSLSGLSWKWSDGVSPWNQSIFLGAPFNFTCSSSSCRSVNASNLCTLVTNGPAAFVGERCNISHAFICMQNTGNICFNQWCHKEYIIILGAISGFFLCTTLAIVLWLLLFRRNRKRGKSKKLSHSSSTEANTPSWRAFTCEQLRIITENFSEENRLVGDAKAGGTYSGILPDGLQVAVKKLKQSRFQKKKEFYSEIGRVARLRHPNIVSIKGCCYNHGDRFIVYEFVPNGPLDRWLHHMPRTGMSLEWSMRMRIAATLAQGITFLHDKVKPHIVHREIRASNVLLDEKFGAHLMGVGLYKFVPWEIMHERTMAANNQGYLAPEFVYQNELTTKSDVYSFGVLLLEIISGRRPAKMVDSVGWESIFEWATPLFQSHRYLELLDPCILGTPDVAVVQKVADLVYTCTQNVPSARPRMSHVLHQLQQLDQGVES